MKSSNGFYGLPFLFFVLFMLLGFSARARAADPCNNPRGGCPGSFGVPTGGVFEFNESFLTDAIRNAWEANGLGSPRGGFFLGDPETDADDDIDGYITTEPLAIQSMHLEHFSDPAYDYRRLKWEDRLPGMWDDQGNLDDNVYPEDDDNIDRPWSDDYLYLPFGDDCNINVFGPGCAEVDPVGGRQTFLAESCPEEFFDGLSEDNRTTIRMLSDSELEARLEALNGWPSPATVNDPDTGIGPDAYTLLMHFAKELERTPHNEYNRYSFFTPGPNWLRILSPVAVIRNADTATADPYLELRFPLFGVYNPLGCAKWYYQEHFLRTFSENDIKVAWAVLIIRARIELDMSSSEPVLDIIMDPTDETTVDFLEGTLRENLSAAINNLTVDPDWISGGHDINSWYAKIDDLMERRYEAFFGQIENLVSLGISIANLQDLMTISLEPLMENYDNLQAALSDFGFTFADLGLVPDPLATTRFKMWEEVSFAGKHQDGICALGLEFLQSVDINDWETAEFNFIPDGKQFALSLSNGFLNSVLPPIAETFSKPTAPPGGSKDRCGNENLIDYLRITKLDLTIPSGQNLGGIPQITELRGEVGFKMPWWAYVAAAALVAAGIVWVAVTLGLSATAWTFLALAVAILAAITDFDINHYEFSSTYAADGSTFRFLMTHENSLPRLDAEIDIGEVHLEPEFSILTTIANPVIGAILSFVPEWIGYNFDKPIPVENVLMTGFKFSFNQSDPTIQNWLLDLDENYRISECSGSNFSDTCQSIRESWQEQEAYRKFITFIKANRLIHYDYEMLISGHICLPPDFYDLEEVIQKCDSDNTPTAVTIDQCVNFYDDDYAGEASCEDYIAVCNNFTEALSASGDTFESTGQALSVSNEDREDILLGITQLWAMILDCDTTEANLLGNHIVQHMAMISEEAYKTAQRALQCTPYGSYVPSAGCTANDSYTDRITLIDDLYIQTVSDGKLSSESEEKLATLAKEVRDEALAHGTDNDSSYGLVKVLNEIVSSTQSPAPCNNTGSGPLPGRDKGMLWSHPWTETDLDGDGFDRFTWPKDCDDFDKTVNPLMPEICNGKDDNCNGFTDEGFDLDHDGVRTCDIPPDCNDLDKNIYPGAPEICGNLMDDDCDGKIDEDNCSKCPDRDGDGFSTRGGICGQVDCDDTNASIYPGAPEIAGDNLDYNCNGMDDCFIATAACGSPLDRRIDVFRRFRDETLEKSRAGRFLINSYYRISPPIARFIEKHSACQTVARWILTPMAAVLSCFYGKR